MILFCLIFLAGINPRAYYFYNDVIYSLFQVFPYHIAVRNLLIVHSELTPPHLVILSDHEVQALPVQRCSNPAAQSCADCLSLQDPYCAWDLDRGLCVDHASNEEGTGELLQSLDYGLSKECPEPIFVAGKLTLLALCIVLLLPTITVAAAAEPITVCLHRFIFILFAALFFFARKDPSSYTILFLKLCFQRTKKYVVLKIFKYS